MDFIVVAAPPGWEEPAILLAEELGCSKVSSCVTGGATRGESVARALAEVPEDAAVVLIHDAARPLVSDEVIERVLTALNDGWDGALPGLFLADTIKRVDEEGRVSETLNRDELRAVQTPQAFAMKPLVQYDPFNLLAVYLNKFKLSGGGWKPSASVLFDADALLPTAL